MDCGRRLLRAIECKSRSQSSLFGRHVKPGKGYLATFLSGNRFLRHFYRIGGVSFVLQIFHSFNAYLVAVRFLSDCALSLFDKFGATKLLLQHLM